MITITFALPAESSGLVRRLQRKSLSTQFGTILITGVIGEYELEILHTGVGQKIAEARLTKYLEKNRPTLLISSGFAGATRTNESVGAFVLARNFSDTRLLEQARLLLGRRNVLTGALFTATKMIDLLSEREEIWRTRQAIAIDMETEALARVCSRRDIPMLSARVLSDTPEHPFPAPGEILFDMERQCTPATRLLGYVMTHVTAIPRLIKFSGQIRNARESLTDGLLQLLPLKK